MRKSRWWKLPLAKFLASPFLFSRFLFLTNLRTHFVHRYQSIVLWAFYILSRSRSDQHRWNNGVREEAARTKEKKNCRAFVAKNVKGVESTVRELWEQFFGGHTVRRVLPCFLEALRENEAHTGRTDSERGRARAEARAKRRRKLNVGSETRLLSLATLPWE